MSKKVNYYAAIATLIGTIIGAGVLGIPYVVSRPGFLIGAIDIILIGIAGIFMHLMLGETTLRTKGNHQLIGYAEKYLGKWGKKLMVFAFLVGMYGALIAYTLGEGEAINAVFGIPYIYSALIFFVLAATNIYIGLKMVKRTELYTIATMIGVIILISVLSIHKIDLSNLATMNLANVAIPYGVILFAYLGTAAVPEMREILIKERKLMKRAITIGTIIPIIIYLLFAFVVVGVVGPSQFAALGPDQGIATIALGNAMGTSMIIFANLFAIFAMATSFIAVSFAIKESFMFDYKMKKNLAWFATLSVPLAVFLLDELVYDLTNFISALGVAGSIAGGLTGILIVLMLWKSKKHGERKPEYTINVKWIGYLLIVLFAFGIIYEILRVTGILNI